jgi:hypothetical protein
VVVPPRTPHTPQPRTPSSSIHKKNVNEPPAAAPLSCTAKRGLAAMVAKAATNKFGTTEQEPLSQLSEASPVVKKSTTKKKDKNNINGSAGSKKQKKSRPPPPIRILQPTPKQSQPNLDKSKSFGLHKGQVVVGGAANGGGISSSAIPSVPISAINQDQLLGNNVNTVSSAKMDMAHVQLQPRPQPEPLAPLLNFQTTFASAEHAAAGQAPLRTHSEQISISHGHTCIASPLPLHRRSPLNGIRFGSANAPLSPLLSNNNKKGDRSGCGDGTQGQDQSQVAMPMQMQIQSPPPLLSLPHMTCTGSSTGNRRVADSPANHSKGSISTRTIGSHASHSHSHVSSHSAPLHTMAMAADAAPTPLYAYSSVHGHGYGDSMVLRTENETASVSSAFAMPPAHCTSSISRHLQPAPLPIRPHELPPAPPHDFYYYNAVRMWSTTVVHVCT